jgi:prepilin-type N-terminal cleavage/methylation domain-containing protein
MTTQTGSKLNLNEGFTLIELMISVTLGSLVIYTATAGFRVASQSMTAANRLGVENAISGLIVTILRIPVNRSYVTP